MDFDLTILGTGAALPANGKSNSAQFLKVGKHHFLIDCGEGTQRLLQKYHINTNKISHVLISHLHGDHYLGLMGLLSSMNLLGRSKKLNIYAPTGLDEIITLQLKHSRTSLGYIVHFHHLDTDNPKALIDNNKLTLTSFPLDHRIPCCGFVWREKPKPRHLNKEKLPKDLSLREIGALQRGEDIVRNGTTIMNTTLTLPPSISRSYAYCSDTKYTESIVEHVQNVQYLYHEATFLSDMEDRAEATYHSTALQAASLAKKANVQHLILGHFSARYKDINQFRIEATKIFEEVILAQEGLTIQILEK